MGNVTLKDIALKARVTVPTVSKVLNKSTGTVRVSPETRTTILEIARNLGYRPNHLARGLRTNRTASLGLIVGGLVTPVRVRCIEHLEDLARRQGFSVMIGSSEGSGKQEAAYVREFLARQVDGLVIASRGHDFDNEHLVELAKKRFPAVIIEVEVPGVDVAQVVVDIKEGSRLLTEHLLSLGRSPVLMVVRSVNLSVRDRLEGFRLAYQQAGRKDAEDHIFYINEEGTEIEMNWNNPWAKIGYEATARIMKNRPETDAVFASNDQVAMGVLGALARLGKKVPSDVAVAGFDGIPESEYYSTPLTTVLQPQEMIAEQVVKIMHELLTNVNASPNKVVIKPQLIVRQSTIG